jgi:hypothetical protein
MNQAQIAKQNRGKQVNSELYPLYWTCFTSPFCHPEFGGEFLVLEILCIHIYWIANCGTEKLFAPRHYFDTHGLEVGRRILEIFVSLFKRLPILALKNYLLHVTILTPKIRR